MDLERWRAQGRVFRYRGHEIFHRTGGEGRSVLLIHGFPLASWGWRRVWGPLTRRHAVFAPDLLGFGFSDKPRGGPYSISDQADLLEALVADYTRNPPYVLANAFGVTVAQELLARNRERSRAVVRGICFLNGGLFPELNPILPAQRILLTPVGGHLFRLVPFAYLLFRRNVRQVFGSRRPPTEKELRDLWRLTVTKGGKRVMHELMRYQIERRRIRDRLVGALTRARVPLRLVLGSADPVSGRQAERWREEIPGSEPILVEGSVGHYPQLEAPDEVVAAFEGLVDAAEAGEDPSPDGDLPRGDVEG